MKLSIVVATYKMQREAPRTILSLLPPLQRCINNIDYEIIVIDNGSPDPLDLDDILSIAPRSVRLNLVRVAPGDALASPVGCINTAVRDYATGDWLMVCIDGARLASSHLVCRTADILARHSHAFTFVASRHLGSKPQMQSIKEGYDQIAEDKLLALWTGSQIWINSTLSASGPAPTTRKTRCCKMRATPSPWPARHGIQSGDTTKDSPGRRRPL